MDFETVSSLVIDQMSEDDLTIIFSYLPFKEKVTCERVCVKWRTVAGRLVAAQRALGNAPTNLTLVDHCSDEKHWVTRLDCIPKRILTNLSVLPKILAKCPDLKAIAITKPREMTFCETSTIATKAKDININNYGSWGQDFEYGWGMDDMQPPANEVSDLMGVEPSTSRLPSTSSSPRNPFDEMRRQNRMYDFEVAVFEKHFRSKSRGKMASKSDKKPEPRPTSQEDFMDIVAKYCKKLECIDLFGLKMSRGYRADQEPAGSWTSVVDSCTSLAHIRTFQMYEKEFAAIVQRVPLTDISVVYGMKGDHLNTVGPMFRKMCIPSVKDFGLQRLSNAPNLAGLRELLLVAVNRNILDIISKMHGLSSLSISLAVNNVEPDDLSCIAKLTRLKRLYIKRREEPLEKFDRPFNDIIASCTHLESIRLTNVIIGDSSLKNVQFYLFELQSLRIELKSGKTNVTLSDRSLHALSELKLLKTVEFDYPNIFTENTLIDYLFRAYNISLLRIHGCKEMIPIPQIGLAAIRQAGCTNRKNRMITVDIDTREKMEIGPVKHMMKMRPRNLNYTISTALDHFSTIFPEGRPVFGEPDEDFDEHRAFFFEAVEM